jgi:hypothetical protein
VFETLFEFFGMGDKLMGDVDEVGDVGDEYDHREECAKLIGGLRGCEGKGKTGGVRGGVGWG